MCPIMNYTPTNVHNGMYWATGIRPAPMESQFLLTSRENETRLENRVVRDKFEIKSGLKNTRIRLRRGK